MAAAFELRSAEGYLSVNWLEYLGAPDLDAAIECVREAFHTKGYSLKPTGRFAVLNVGEMKTAILDKVDGDVHIKHLPLADDASHSGIFGYTATDLAVAVAIKELVNLGNVHPTLAD